MMINTTFLSQTGLGFFKCFRPEVPNPQAADRYQYAARWEAGCTRSGQVCETSFMHVRELGCAKPSPLVPSAAAGTD